MEDLQYCLQEYTSQLNALNRHLKANPDDTEAREVSVVAHAILLRQTGISWR